MPDTPGIGRGGGLKGAFEHDDDIPQAPAQNDTDDEANMSFAQRITSQLKKLRKKGAPAPTQQDSDEDNQAGTWIGNPAKPTV